MMNLLQSLFHDVPCENSPAGETDEDKDCDPANSPDTHAHWDANQIQQKEGMVNRNASEFERSCLLMTNGTELRPRHNEEPQAETPPAAPKLNKHD